MMSQVGFAPRGGELKHALPELWSQNVGDYVTALTVSADGTLVAVGTGRGEVWAFDVASGTLAFRVVAHREGVLSASFAPRGRLLATAGQDGEARLFDLSGSLIAALTGGSAWVEHVAWAPDGQHLVTTAGRVARVWTPDGRAVLETAPQESTITGAAWNRKGDTLALACYGGVHLIDPFKGSQVRGLAWRGSLISLSWSPNNAVIACATQESAVHFWRLATGKDSEISGFVSKPRALAWDHESKLLATGGDAVVSVWSFQGKGPEGKPPKLLTGHQALCTALAFHPKKPRLASGADDTGILIWQPSSSDKPVAFAFLEETVTALQWAHGGQVLVAADAAGTVRAWREPNPSLAT